MNIFSELIIIIFIFTAIVHATEAITYGCHLSGVRTKQVATALSFVKTTLLISRLAYMIQAPFMLSRYATLIDIRQMEMIMVLTNGLIVFAIQFKKIGDMTNLH